MPFSEVIDERLRNLTELISKVTTQVENITTCVQTITVAFSKLENLPEKVDTMSREVFDIKSKVGVIEAQTLVPIKDLSNEIAVLRDKISSLETETAHTKNNWKNLLSHSMSFLITILAAVLGYCFSLLLK